MAQDNILPIITSNKNYKASEIADARRWFKDKLAVLQGSPTGLKNTKISDLRYRGDLPLIGRMVYYLYKAKGDGILPYWDMHPLVIIIDESTTHFLGLNLHYLPPNLRALLLLRLIELLNNVKFNKTTYLKLSYRLLKSASKYKWFAPCLKMYIKENIQSGIMIIRPESWHKAILLPTAKFKGASQSKVWADSRKIYS